MSREKKHPNLQIDRIVPIHATIGPYSELVKTAADEGFRDGVDTRVCHTPSRPTNS